MCNRNSFNNITCSKVWNSTETVVLWLVTITVMSNMEQLIDKQARQDDERHLLATVTWGACDNVSHLRWAPAHSSSFLKLWASQMPA